MTDFSSRFSPKKASGGFATQIQNARALVYVLIDGTAPNQRYFVIEIEPAKHDAYLAAFNGSQDFDLKDFGAILHSGKGEPTDALKNELREKYGLYED